MSKTAFPLNVNKTAFPFDIYILVLFFIFHFSLAMSKSLLYMDIVSPVVAFYSAYVIYSSVKKRAEKETDLSWYFLFAFTLIYGVLDIIHLIVTLVLNTNLYHTPLYMFYLLPSFSLVGLVTYMFFRIYKKWNKIQLLVDISTSGIIIAILIWSVMFSNFGFKYDNYLDLMYTVLYVISDFIVFSFYVVFYFSARKKKSPLSFNLVFAGIIVYATADLYYLYMDLTGNHLFDISIDFLYTLTCVLMAVGSYFRSIRPIHRNDSYKEYAGLPYNYGKLKKVQLGFALFSIVILYPLLGWHDFFVVLMIIGVYQLITKYIQISIKTEYLLKKEQDVNEYLERTIQERTADLLLANKALEDISNKDVLTGLYNRRFFLKTLDHLIEDKSCEKFALFYMDMNRFKAINDTHGHNIGDKVLYALSKRFANNCKENCVIYRVGGDEFAIIVKNYEDVSYLYDAIHSLIKISQVPIRISPYLFSISLSIGIAKYPEDATDVGTLLKYADISMYEAKTSNTGKNYFFFDSTLSEKIQKKHNLEVRLKNANFDKEFKLYYQPQYRTSDKKLIGMEALIRWVNYEDSFISPSKFIPIAEEIGIIHDLGEWVINQAIKQIKLWNTKYDADFKVGINISPLQVENSDFVNMIRQEIYDSDIKPEWIDLEITEGVAMSSQASMEEILSGLSSIGVSISIDDFGTGYSSLSYIKRFDIDTLKIAKELIETIVEDKNTYLIVNAIIKMAKGMKLNTIAEGVEDEKQLEILKELDCDEIQGHIFGKAVPPEVFEQKHIIPSI